MSCWNANLRRLALGAAVLVVGACTTPGPAPVPEPRLDPDQVQRGAFVFLSARGAGEDSPTCSGCHPNGTSDGKLWRNGQPADPGEPGARRTPSLRGAWQTPPYLWDGSAPDIASAVGHMLREHMGGHTLPDYDVRALEAFVLSLTPFDRGRVRSTGVPREPVSLAARRGHKVYARAGCVDCHPAPVYTTRVRADVGTGLLDVPSLLGVAERGVWGHDGRWKHLDEAVNAMVDVSGVELSFDERLQLLEYVKLL